MPIARYQIRNKYCLADPELYRAADKDDPEALLEGVAMAGLVGVLRQLGDLAEFAAEIFHDLHEEVMVTAARGHDLMARVQQLEAEVPSLEKAFLSQTHHSSFISNGGINWHPNLRSEQNLISRGDLPRFIMDSYEECRGPPRLFLLDKFDVAGAGGCLKRYTDPSFFKMESASSGLATVEVHRENRIRKIKKKGAQLRNGETPEVVPTHTKLHQLLLEERIDNAFSDPSHLVKLKKRQSNGSAVETKSGKSYMEKLLDTPSPDHKVICETSIYPQHARLMSDETSETGIKILEISTISPVKRSLGNESTCSWPSEQEPELKPSSQMHWKTDEDLVKVHEQESAGVTDEMSSIHPKVTDETELAVDEQNKRKGSLDRYHSDDMTSEVDNYLDALATMESEMEADNGCRRQNNFLNIQKLTDSDDKEYQLRARFSDSQSFGDSSISDEISSLKLDRNEEHASDSQSIGTSSISDEIISFKRDRNEEMEQQALFSDSQYFGNSTLDLNSFFKKDRSCFSHSDSLSTVVENVQSKPILFPSTKYYESDIEDTPSNHLPQIVELQNTDCGEFVMHDDAHDKEEDISDSVQASSVSCLMNSGHILLHSDLGVASPMSLPTGTQSDETPSDPIELHLRLADDEDSECHVESIARITDALSLMNFDACPVVSSEKYPLNNLDDGDQYVSYDALSQISNDLEKAPEDECSDHSEIKVLLAESSNENCSEILVSREISSQEHPICSSMEGLDLSSGTILPLDGLASEAVDGTIATQLNSEDLSPVHVSSFTGEHGSDLIHYSPQDEPDSVGVEVKCFDQQSNFEEISRMVHGHEISGSTCSVDADEDYIGKHNHVMVNDMVTAKVQSDDQAVYDVPSADSAENDVSINTCPASGITSSASRNLSNLQEPLLVSSYSHEMKKEPNEVESTEISVDLNAEKRENQLEPSSDITFSNIISSPIRNLRNLEESLFNFIDPHEKETEINKAVARESLTESEAQKVVDRPDFASPDVQLTLNRSFPCVPSNSEICNIQDSSLMEKTQYSSSVNDKKIVPKFPELETQESESISLWHNELLQNGKDGSLFPSYNQLESGTHLEQFLQVGQQDARLLLRDVENSSSEKLQSEQIQISNHLKEKRSFHGASESAPEIYLDQPESSESLSQSAGQEINPTKHVDWEHLLLPDHFPKASEINLEEIPPMPPLPPMQWRTGKVQHISLASFQPIKMIKINESTQYSLPTSERGTLQYQNPFLPIMAVESDKLQHTSGFSVGGHSVSIPFQLPIMINEAKSQYNYLLWERSQIQNPFLTLPVPVVSTSRPQHGYMVASEGEVAQYPNPSPPMPPDEHDSAGHDPISTQELSQPPSRLMTEPSLEVKTLQQSSSNLEGEQGDPSISPTLPPNMETVQPNHSLLPSEGEMVLSLDTSALTSDFEFEKPKNKLPRPRNPLIDAVAALDKSKLRKVSERVRPQIAPKVDERDSLLEQIRTKSFNLKPAAPTRPIIQGPKTNLKVAAILEKANAIRQALAGSDEDDDVDNWSDS